MSDYTILAEVGESLSNVLWLAIQADPQLNILITDESQISLQSPFDLREDDSVRLSIYLYRVVEDGYTKNQFPISNNGTRQRKPPLTLDLCYLVTPMVGTPREQQIVLGAVLQILYDHSILAGADLIGSLANSAEEVRVILNAVTLEEIARVWQALEMSYRLSVSYMVRVAMVDSRREISAQSVVGRSTEYGGK
jgi:hypothetical protein